MTETTKTAFERVAEEFAGAFTTTKRGDETIVTLRDEYRDTWAQSLVFEAHGSMLPDDWRYACIASAAEAIAECADESEAEDRRGEWADSEVDVYNGARLEWLSSHLSRAGYCDEAAAEFGPSEADTFERIGLGQYFEAEEVFGLVLAGIVARAEELEDEETDEGEGE